MANSVFVGSALLTDLFSWQIWFATGRFSHDWSLAANSQAHQQPPALWCVFCYCSVAVSTSLLQPGDLVFDVLSLLPYCWLPEVCSYSSLAVPFGAAVIECNTSGLLADLLVVSAVAVACRCPGCESSPLPRYVHSATVRNVVGLLCNCCFFSS